MILPPPPAPQIRNPQSSRFAPSAYLESFQLLTVPERAGILSGSVRRKNSRPTAEAPGALSEHLAATGFRFTQQRQGVYDVLLGKRDHPTAEEVFLRSKRAMPDISMATVYNCLDALVKSGLVRQVTVERGAARFCPNMHEHWHFHCTRCGGVFDMDLPDNACGAFLLPRGFKIDQFEIAAHGMCPACSARRRKQPSKSLDS
jgi:Fur family peroxide stress response transcriptional regulator